MEEFEVIGPIAEKSTTDNDVSIIALNFRDPKFARILSKIQIRPRTVVAVDDDLVRYTGKVIGKVQEIKGPEDVQVSLDFDAKYAGGYSIDGVEVYLDQRFPRSLNVDGLLISTVKSIGLHHKLPEKWLTNSGYDYLFSHDIATRVEKRYVESLGVSWRNYLREVDSKLREIYKEELRKKVQSYGEVTYLNCRFIEGFE